MWGEARRGEAVLERWVNLGYLGEDAVRCVGMVNDLWWCGGDADCGLMMV